MKEKNAIEKGSFGTVEGKKYWAFISYSSKDRKWGEWLHRRLERYPIPPEFQGMKIFDGSVLGKNLRPVFRDRDELSGSSDLGEAIQDALKRSRFLVVLCSKNSAKSKWVNKEIEEFRAMGKGGRILALILDGEPNATSSGRPEEECFPPALRHPAEPIAGDLRKEGDGKERGFLKILAGIAQLDFDKLYRRHERMQARRRLTVGIAATLLIALFAGLAGYAWVQKNEAVVARDLADAQRKRAEAARSAANRIIYVMLYDIQDELFKKGMTGLHERINKVTRDYFEDFPEDEIDDSVLRERASALGNSSLTLLSLGRLQEAKSAAEEAVKLCEERLRRSHDSSDALRGLAISTQCLGNALLPLEGPGAAKVHFERSIEFFQRLYDAEQSVSNASYLAMSHTHLGNALLSLEGPGAAKVHYERNMELMRTLYDAEPSALHGLGLAISHLKLGDVLLSIEGPGAAKVHYERSMELMRTLYDAEPRAYHARSLAVSHEKLGDVLLSLEGPEAAKVHYERMMELVQRLYDAEPSAQNARGLAVSHEKLGDVLLSLEGSEAAKVHYERRMELTRTLYDEEQSAENTRGLAVSHYKMAVVLMSGNPSEEDAEVSRNHARAGLKLLLALRDAGQLDSQAASWIPKFERLAR